jgi:MHS family proline/betaine transporter-like MFS transporter
MEVVGDGRDRKDQMTIPRAAAQHRWQVIAGTVGNVMEWYDFAVYGYFVPVIARHFFPASDPTTSLIAAFGAFAAGFLMRPLGGVVFGQIGDRLGRKAALTLSVLAMAIPTFLIGILPDHAVIGPAATMLLVLCRMVQGLSVGGEFTTSIVYLVEGAPPHRRGLAGSWSGFGATMGVLLGSAVAALTTSLLSETALHSWGWRVPFLVGLLVGLAGLLIRRGLPEPVSAEHAAAKLPVIESFVTEWRAMLQVVGLTVLQGAAFYLIFVYLVTWFEKEVHLWPKEALDINTFNMVILLAVTPVAGLLSDRFGRKPLLIAGALGLFLAAWPLFWLMHHPNAGAALGGQAGFAVLSALFMGVVPVTMVEAFPARVRCTAIAVGYNISLGLIGGTVPMVATFLIERTHEDLSPAYYLMATAAVSLLTVLTLRETSRRPLR